MRIYAIGLPAEYPTPERVDNAHMRSGLRIAGWAALVGFLAVTAWAAGLTPSSCCSASCEQCPASFCKDSAADRSPRAEPALGLSPVAGPAVFFSIRFSTIQDVARILSSRPSEFTPPLRN